MRLVRELVSSLRPRTHGDFINFNLKYILRRGGEMGVCGVVLDGGEVNRQ